MFDKPTSVVIRNAYCSPSQSTTDVSPDNAPGFWNKNGGLAYTDAAGTDTLIGCQVIVDPGNAGAIPVNANGVCNLVTAGAETRTLAAPTHPGQRVILSLDTHGGNCAVTASTAFDASAHVTATFTAAGQMIELLGATIADALVWRLRTNMGATLS